MNAIMNVFVDTQDLKDGTPIKLPIMAHPLPFTLIELEVMQWCMEKMRGMVPPNRQHSAKEANFKLCSAIGAMAKWEREHG